MPLSSTIPTTRFLLPPSQTTRTRKDIRIITPEEKMMRRNYYNNVGGGDVVELGIGVEVTFENSNTIVHSHPDERKEHSATSTPTTSGRSTAQRRNYSKYEKNSSRSSSSSREKAARSTTDEHISSPRGVIQNPKISIYTTSTPPTKEMDIIARRTTTTTKVKNPLKSKGVLLNLDQSYPDLEFSTYSTSRPPTTTKDKNIKPISSSNDLDDKLAEMAIMKKFSNPTTTKQSSPTKTNYTTSSYEEADDDYENVIVDNNDDVDDDTYTVKELKRRRKLLIGLIISAIIFCVAIGLTVLGLQQHREKQQELNNYVIDFSCTNDNECAVKNVGSCCGTYFPKCVNVGFIPDPTPKTSCQENQGMAGGTTTCGYATIDRCGCNTNTDAPATTTTGFCVGYQDDNIVSYP